MLPIRSNLKCNAPTYTYELVNILVLFYCYVVTINEDVFCLGTASKIKYIFFFFDDGI